MKYKALIARLILPFEIGATQLVAKSDSQLVTNQVKGEFQAKDPQLGQYLNKVKSLDKSFEFFYIEYILRAQNSRADLLSKLANTKKLGNNQLVIQEVLDSPIIDLADV